jgi:hypothetical protein
MIDSRGEQQLDAATAAKRITIRAALLDEAKGASRWWLRPLYLFALGAMIYITWTWSGRWSLAAYLLLLCILALEAQMSRRLDAVVRLLEQLDTFDSSVHHLKLPNKKDH